MRIRLIPIVCVLVAVASSAWAADWPAFRGPAGSGVAKEADVPDTFSATKNIVWKTPLPGAGASSPIAIGDKVLLTCYSGYGLNEDEPGNIAALKHHVVCIDGKSGKILWDQSTKALPKEQSYGGFLALHGYASGTPASDGKVVYAFFGRSGVYAYDLEGKSLWHTVVGEKTHEWGSGTSVVLAGKLVIVNASVESGALVALNAADGKEAWRAEGIDKSWSTPALVTLPDGKQEVVVSMHSWVRGYDPTSGQELWQCASVKDYVCPSVVAHEGIVYITGGRKSLTLAIRAGGRGDVTATHLLWESGKGPKVPTPLYHDGLLCWVSNQAIASCLKADSGELVYEERLKVSGGGDKVYASLILAGDKLYAVTREKGIFVLASGSEWKIIGQNELGDPSIFNGTPAVYGNRLLLRSDQFLYCIGQ